MSWFRLYNSFANHRKIKKVSRELCIPQPHASGYVITFLCEVSSQAPDGCLSGWEVQDIEEAAKWDGEEGEFCGALVSAGWLVDGPLGPEVNDWMEYAEGFKKAKRAREARSEKSLARNTQKQQIGSCSQNTASPLKNSLQAPKGTIPFAERRGEERKRKEMKGDEREEKKRKKREDKTPMSLQLATASKKETRSHVGAVTEVWKSWCSEFSKLRAKQGRRQVNRRMWGSGGKEYKAVVRALDSGRTPEELCMAVEGMFLTPHNLGDNPQGQEYLGIHIAVKPENIERFVGNAERPPQKRPQGWVKETMEFAMSDDSGVSEFYEQAKSKHTAPPKALGGKNE